MKKSILLLLYLGSSVKLKIVFELYTELRLCSYKRTVLSGSNFCQHYYKRRLIVKVLVVSRWRIGVANCQSRASGFSTCSLYLNWSEQQNNSFANEWMKDHIFELQRKIWI